MADGWASSCLPHAGSLPLIGPWEQRREMVKKAAALMQNLVIEHVRQPENGEAFDAVDDDAPVLDWDQLGLPLLPEPVPA